MTNEPWETFGTALLRIYLTGQVQVERGERLVREAQLGGPQGRLALAVLVTERKRAVTQAELADVLWPDAVPASWQVALAAIVSRLRATLAGLGLPRSRVIAAAFGCYQLSPPDEVWVDVEAAIDAVHTAEGAIAAGDVQAAYGPSLLATTILRRPFLAGDVTPWVEDRRTALAETLVRAIDCRVDALAANGEMELAVVHAREAVRLEPFRESGYRRLMRLRADAGDRAEAVRVYRECEKRLRDELGVSPSAATEGLFREITS
jgi:DNA-binding SARP family transcriptional activator